MSATIEVHESTPSGSVQIRTRPFPTGTTAAEATVAAASAGYATVTEEGNGAMHVTKIVLAALPVTVGNTTGISFGTKHLINFPLGSIFVIGTTVEDFSWGLANAGNITPIDAADGGDIALGTTATADATLGGTDVNLLASTSYDPLSAAMSARGAINAVFDGTSTPVACHLNAIIDDADVSDGASDVLEANGTIRIAWINLGG